jgi:hypothetical protein
MGNLRSRVEHLLRLVPQPLVRREPRIKVSVPGEGPAYCWGPPLDPHARRLEVPDRDDRWGRDEGPQEPA